MRGAGTNASVHYTVHNQPNQSHARARRVCDTTRVWGSHTQHNRIELSSDSRTTRTIVSVVTATGKRPAPIPNPEAKPDSADGTAPARVRESRTPPSTHHTVGPEPPTSGPGPTAFLSEHRPPGSTKNPRSRPPPPSPHLPPPTTNHHPPKNTNTADIFAHAPRATSVGAGAVTTLAGAPGRLLPGIQERQGN